MYLLYHLWKPYIQFKNIWNQYIVLVRDTKVKRKFLKLCFLEKMMQVVHSEMVAKRLKI